MTFYSSEISSSLVAGTGRRCGGCLVGRDRNLQQVLPPRKWNLSPGQEAVTLNLLNSATFLRPLPESLFVHSHRRSPRRSESQPLHKAPGHQVETGWSLPPF